MRQKSDENKTDSVGSKKDRIASVISTAILIFLLAVVGYMAVQNMKGKVPSLFGYALVRIQTSSMEKTIPTGSYILIKMADADDVKVGDVITFYSDDPAIIGCANTHRVKEITETDGKLEFVTKGDNNITADSYRADGDKLIGIYKGNLPVLTVIVGALTTKWIFILIILIPSIALVTMSLRDIMEKASAIRKENEQKRILDEIERLRKSGELDKEIEKINSHPEVTEEQNKEK